MLSRQQVTQKLSTLPPDIREWLISPEVAFYIRKLGQDLELVRVQTERISELILSVAVGAITATECLNTLQEDLALKPETARRVAERIYTEIFSRIQGSLLKLGVDIRGLVRPQGPS
ncbi:MAG: hypothetical protein A2939_05350 [Parcubacteria group bacterium RIFCSPLOWO2_01_FULL_48_18]|nr:MAG: hypothetical protein A3J67_06620 [Parcubacteria group bacterium RIFCSPHIGHO2_02_FULL_48_10b]OHB22525.1 MAG: hypothetical protein A2939_05350 [Parcubacteria group bacterium RIFCSPLOWO2_01_FULL_48_18]